MWICARSLALVIGLLGLSGCGMDFDWSFGRKNTPPEKPPERLPEHDAILGDTVGSRSLLGNAELLRLRGFGLVAGLGDAGGSDCPTTIRSYLVDYFNRELLPKDGRGAVPVVSPQKLIDSPDTAVVAVEAFVAAGLPKGSRFDVFVQAIGAQTRSLAGGVLLRCELKLFSASDQGRRLVAGRELAYAEGPLFTLAAEQEPAEEESLTGEVLGGGVTVIDRAVRLLLQEPSYSSARQIEQRINERFGQNPKTAEAMSKGYLELHTPPAYAERPAHFIQLVTHLLLENTPAYCERRLRELAEEAHGDDEKLAHLSLVWEGMGRVAVPAFQSFYESDEPAVRYFAARAGLRLGDLSALPVVGQIAASEGEPRRLAALDELGACGLPQAARHVAPMLDDGDDDVRIAAYEALLNYPSQSIQSQLIRSALSPRHLNLALDVVDTQGPPLIYVRRTRDPRIAVFGRSVGVTTPLFYNHPADWVTLNARDAADDITVFCRTRSGNRLSDPILTPPRVVDLVQAMAALPVKDSAGRFGGIGLPYSGVIQILADLRGQKAIASALVIEPSPLRNLLTTYVPTERPEADEAALSGGETAPAEAPPEPAGASAAWERSE